jgi:hypothetical protein
MAPLARWWERIQPTVLDPLRFPPHPFAAARFGLRALWPVALLARALFRDEAAPALLAGMGAHSFLPLEAPLTLEAGEAYTLEFHKNGPTEGVIWTYPRRDDAPVQRVLESPRDVPENYGLELTFIPQDRPKPAYVGRSMSLYELPDVRPYAAAPDCDVTLRSYDEMETSCRRASKLVRLTVHMKDWSAAVNGEEVPIGLEDDTFQVIDVPEGTARIVFRYWPSGLGAALFGAGTALLLIIAAFASAGLRRYRNRGRNSTDEVAALA